MGVFTTINNKCVLMLGVSHSIICHVRSQTSRSRTKATRHAFFVARKQQTTRMYIIRVHCAMESRAEEMFPCPSRQSCALPPFFWTCSTLSCAACIRSASLLRSPPLISSPCRTSFSTPSLSLSLSLKSQFAYSRVETLTQHHLAHCRCDFHFFLCVFSLFFESCVLLLFEFV